MQRIKSVGVLSCAKMLGVLYGCMGLLFIPFALIAGLASMATQQANSAIGGAAMLAFGILAPFLYGAMGFVFGAIGAWIYNLIAKRLGGIEIQLEPLPTVALRRETVCPTLPDPKQTAGVKIKSLAAHFEPHRLSFMQKTMLAVVKPEAAPGAEIREVKVPAFGRNDVLVKVKVASICGTDLHIYEWDRWAQNRIHPPLIPGHEFCGEVAAFGDEVTSVKEGDFVSAEMHVACGKCLQCRTGEAHICQNVKIIGVDADGAFAEYVVIPESNIWKLDPGDSAGVRVDSRSAGQRRAHRAGGRDCGQDRRHHRLRADRTVLHCGGARGGRDHGLCHRGE